MNRSYVSSAPRIGGAILVGCLSAWSLARSDGSPVSAAETTSKEKNQVIEITFSEVNMNMTANMVFRPFLVTDRVRELEGKRVRISGHMLNLGSGTKTDDFILLKNKECKFGPEGQADHLIKIVMKSGTKVKYRTEPLTVEGVFKLNPTSGADGSTWSVFDLLEATAK